MTKLHAQAVEIAAGAREASPLMARADGGQRNAVLSALARRLRRQATGIINANRRDLAAGRKAGLSRALLDRLQLDRRRIEKMATGVEQVASLLDPVGRVIDGWSRPNGLQLSRVRVPLGTVLIIFESRPNVTVDAAALCIKSGNAAILRGGKEARYSNQSLGRVVRAALADAGLPADGVQVVKDQAHGLVNALLGLDHLVDVVIPRGGKNLIRAVMEHSTIPVIKHLDGVCHVYVDAAADLEMARAIALNAKVQRPGVCNAMETLLVHRAVAGEFLVPALRALRAAGVRLKGDACVRKLARGVKVEEAGEEDWRSEYLDLVLNVGVVHDLDQAMQHINTYGSHHTDAIVTRDLVAASRFQREVGSSSVMVNASTRFSDGFEYGLGAEIGISTDKLHARGPVGLEGLTTYKWIVQGDGQVRV